MKLDEIKIDTEKMESGDWVENIPEFEGMRLKVRGMNNNDYRKLERKLLNAIPRSKRISGVIDPDEQDRVMNTCLLNCCLLDWEGITTTNGSGVEEPVPFSKEMARTLICEPAYRRFRDAVIWAATVVVEQKLAEREDITKN